MNSERIQKKFFNNFEVVTEKRNACVFQNGDFDIQELIEICYKIFPDLDNIFFVPKKLSLEELKKVLVLKYQMAEMDVSFQLKEGHYEKV